MWSPAGFDRAAEVTPDESPRVKTRYPDEDVPGSWLPVACTRCRRLASHSLPRTLEVIDKCDRDKGDESEAMSTESPSRLNGHGAAIAIMMDARS